MSRILVSGATGFVGQRLSTSLLSKNHQVIKLSRKKSHPDIIAWDVDRQTLNSDELENFNSIVHLAGETILGLWTKKKKEKIYRSRIQGTKLLVSKILKLKSPPKTFICASAVGIYGQNILTPVTEESALANDFLANVCREWESACQPLVEAGIRVVNLRIGVVIDPSGGMLKQMLLPFKLGLGAWLGSGKQHLAWVSLDDLIQITEFCLNDLTVAGPINVVAPEMITNKVFCQSLAKKLNRFCLFGIPKVLIQVLLGKEFSRMIIGNQKIIPKKLQDLNYQFIAPTFSSYLEQKKF